MKAITVTMKSAIFPILFVTTTMVVIARFGLYSVNIPQFYPTKTIATYARQQASRNESNYKALWNMFTDMRNQWLYSISQEKNGKRIYQLTEDHLILERRIEGIMESSIDERQSSLNYLREMIAKKIDQLQNPKDCGKSRFLVCEAHAKCGFGCYLHILVNCLIRAFESERVMIYHNEDWDYADGGWEFAFQSITKCKIDFNVDDIPSVRRAARDEKFVKVEQADISPWLAWTIPAEISSDIIPIHGDPFAWWISQFVDYLMRPKSWLKKETKQRMQEIGISSPIAGIHIRRGDKLKSEEAAFHPVEEYMVPVVNWFQKLQFANRDIKKMVYVATVERDVMPELREKYPDYHFLINNEITTKLRRVDRYNENALAGVVQDIYFLSKCDFLACTLSSSVCRTAYELMINNQADATLRFYSVDMPYRFKWKSKSPWKAILNHTPRNRAELEIRTGDDLIVPIDSFSSYNAGYVNGTNERTGNTGTFPAHKARPLIRFHNYTILRDNK